MTIHRSIAALLCALALTACGTDAVQDITGPMPSARVRFFNFGVDAPSVNFYANDTKVTAISATTCAILTDANRELCTTAGAEATTGVAYGGVGSSGYYSAIEPGQYTFSGRIAAAADKNVVISKVSATLADGKAYSYFQSGIYDATTKSVEGFVVEDAIPAKIEWDKIYVRFVNAISNSQPMTLVLRSTATGAEGAVGGPVAYKSAGAFVGFQGSGVVDLYTLQAGSNTPVITRTAVTMLPGRVYTITARGDMTVTSTTATNRPFLDNTANR